MHTRLVLLATWCLGVWTAAADAATEPITWTNKVGVGISDGSLRKLEGAPSWSSGAASSRSIVSGSGFVEFTATETDKGRMCGLSTGDTDAAYADIDFALNLKANGIVA